MIDRACVVWKTAGERRKEEKMGKLLAQGLGVVLLGACLGLCWFFASHELAKPVGFYFGPELIGVGVKEPGRGFVQYRLDEYLPIYGQVPELHQEVQVGPNWQPAPRPGEDPEHCSGGSPDKE